MRPGAWGPPFWGGESLLYLSANRNKRGVRLDLKTDHGKEIVWKLIKGADVFVQAFRGGVVEGLELDYESVKAKRPEIIYGRCPPMARPGPQGPARLRPLDASLLRHHVGDGTCRDRTRSGGWFGGGFRYRYVGGARDRVGLAPVL